MSARPKSTRTKFRRRLLSPPMPSLGPETLNRPKRAVSNPKFCALLLSAAGSDQSAVAEAGARVCFKYGVPALAGGASISAMVPKCRARPSRIIAPPTCMRDQANKFFFPLPVRRGEGWGEGFMGRASVWGTFNLQRLFTLSKLPFSIFIRPALAALVVELTG